MSEFKWPQEGSAGSGDVVGPGSSTNDAIARFDGTSGKLIQDSTVTLSDTGVIAGATIDGDNNTVQDLPLTALKTSLSDATEVIRRDSSGVVVSGPMTVTDAGDANGLKTIDLRNDDDLSGASQWMVRVENRNDLAASRPHMEFRRGRTANADLQNGDDIGGLDFHPRHNGTNLSAAKIEAEYTGDGTTRKADVVIYTSNDAAPAERLRIQADGKVIVAGDFEVNGTTTTVNTQNLDVEDKNIKVNYGGTDASAAGAGLTVEGTGAAALATLQYDNSLTSKWKLGASGAEDEVLTRTATQTVTGKSIDADTNTITNIENADIKVGAAIARAKLAAGTASHVVINDGSGNFSSEATLAISRGGTGQSSATAAFDALAPTTTLGDISYHDGTDNVRLAGNTSAEPAFLQQTGNGTVSAAPVWRKSSDMAKIRLNTSNGYGSTSSNKIRRFLNAPVNTGTGLTYTDSATDGASFTCTVAGIYSFTYADAFSGVNDLGLSINSSQLTTNIGSITAADRLVHTTTGAADYFGAVSITVALAVNDVVRPHTSGGAASSVTGRVSFTAQRIL